MSLKPSISSMFVSKADDNDISPKVMIEVPKGITTIDIYIHAIVLLENNQVLMLVSWSGF